MRQELLVAADVMLFSACASHPSNPPRLPCWLRTARLGHTEMEVEARDTVQNKAVTIKLDFASGSSGGTAGVAEAQRMHIRV